MKMLKLSLLLFIVSAAALAGPSATRTNQLQILTAAVTGLDTDAPVLTLNGQNFGSAPGVLIGTAWGAYRTLLVSSSSDTTVTAALGIVAPGTYDVIVTGDGNQSGTIAVTVGAAGPAGPQGPAGPVGPQGPKGDTGATGARGPSDGYLKVNQLPMELALDTAQFTTVVALRDLPEGWYVVNARTTVDNGNTALTGRIHCHVNSPGNCAFMDVRPYEQGTIALTDMRHVDAGGSLLFDCAASRTNVNALQSSMTAVAVAAPNVQ